ncbi:DNA ligase, partial [Candidatus Woesearchaeota archaeon]|nr:DNA ligase [Candidatus Woesearchaeota archaeon]
MFYSELADVYNKLENSSKRLDKTFIIYKLFSSKKIDDLKILAYLIEGRVFPKWDERKIGFSSKLIIKALNNATGTSIDQIEKLWAEKGDLGLVAEILIVKKKQTTLFSNKLTVKKV